MSASFKVEKLSGINSLTKTKSSIKSQQNSKNSELGQITFSIPSLSILTYNSHALIEILTCFLEHQSGLPPYAQVQKALQILSQPITDDILKSDLHTLILKNIHKKRDLYVFFCLWSQFLSIQHIIELISQKKLQQKILHTILITYLSDCTKNVIWYQNLALTNQLRNLIEIDQLSKNSRILEEIDAQITNQTLENPIHFQKVLVKLINIVQKSSNLPVSNQLKKISINFFKNKNNKDFINQMIEKLLSEISQKKEINDELSNIMNYISNNDLREVRDIFETSVLQKLENKFNSEKKQMLFDFVYCIFNHKINNSAHKFLKTNLKNLFVSTNFARLWIFFDENFTIFHVTAGPNDKIRQKRQFLIELINELSKQNEKTQKNIQRMLFSKYIYHFMEGKGFNYPLELRFLNRKSDLKFESQRQVISKCIKHINNQKLLNVMTFNKSSWPESIQWQKDLSLKVISKKYEQIGSYKKILARVIQSWQKYEEQMLKENKKIELLFNVVRIQIDKKPICVTTDQLAQLLKAFAVGRNIDIESLTLKHYRRKYSPIDSNDEQKMAKSMVVQKDQEIHPIIMEAKIIKLMKKQLKKATVQQIAKHLNFNQQKTHQTVKKLVTKGYLEEHQDETYSYEA